jgi:hypothetical protein
MRNWSKDDMLLSKRIDAAKLSLPALENSYLISDLHTYVENILQIRYIGSVMKTDQPVDSFPLLF